MDIEKVEYVPSEVAEMVEAGLKQIRQTEQAQRVIKETTQLANRQSWDALRLKHSLCLPEALRKYLGDRFNPKDDFYEDFYLNNGAPDRGDVSWVLKIPGLAPIEVRFVGMSSGPVQNASTVPAWKVDCFVIGEWFFDGYWHFCGSGVKRDELHLVLGEARRRWIDYLAAVEQNKAREEEFLKTAAQPAKPELEYIPVDDPISVPEVGENVLNIVRRLVRQEMQIAAQN